MQTLASGSWSLRREALPLTRHTQICQGSVRGGRTRQHAPATADKVEQLGTALPAETEGVSKQLDDDSDKAQAIEEPEKDKAEQQTEGTPTTAELLATISIMKQEIEALREENEVLYAQLAPPDEPETREAAPTIETPSPTGAPTLEQLEAAVKWPKAGASFWTQAPRDPAIVLSDDSPPGRATVDKDPAPMHIVHVTAEMAPCAKVGGLGDVVQGLAKASLESGHNVQVILPHYTSLPADEVHDLTLLATFDCPKGEEWDGEMRVTSLQTCVHSAMIDTIPVLLIGPSNRDHCNLFRGDRIYGGSYNELEAYLYFCRASLEALKVTGAQPNILHLHEWQCSAASMLYWDVYFPEGGLVRPRIVLTIHNMDNSGECRQDEFAVTGVSGDLFADINKALDERTIGHNPERLNLMKGGLVYSNAVTTVSPTYADEARSGGAAGYLRALLNEPQVAAKFSGVLNGIDTAFWCPSVDPLIPAPFNAAAPAGKALCKRFVQLGLGLEVEEGLPLVVCVSRLVPQKGIHLIRSSIGHTVARGAQFVMLGSGHADGDFRALADAEFKDSTMARLLIMYSEPLAHMLYAAADFVIVPSLFEPCGLTQMIAMRYGALPVVRRTGGLADTVFDADDDATNGNGFVFDGADEAACHAALDRAFELFKDAPSKYRRLSLRNMDSDMSWRVSAGSYHDLYRQVKA